MTPSLKKLCIYALADALGTSGIQAAPDDAVKWRCQKLREAGEQALNGVCKQVKVNKSKINQAQTSVMKLHKDGDELDMVQEISFLLAALCDLEQFMPDNEGNNRLIKRSMWVLALWDTKLDKFDIYDNAAKRYQKWIS